MRRSTGREKEKARKAKINEFIQRKFPDEKRRALITELSDAVWEDTFEEVNLKLYKDKNVRIWRDAENYLHIKIKRTEDDELKA